MATELREAFIKAEKENRSALVTFITAGFPRIEDTVPVLKGLQEGGADVIELGIPFSDPIADGPTIQAANVVALDNGMSVKKVLEQVRQARAAGVTVPIVLMGYYNPILIYGEKKMIHDTKQAGANGFIIVDLPPEEAVKFRDLCSAEGLSYVPLVAPSTTDDRLKLLGEIADSFMYVVSRMGITGAGISVTKDVGPLCEHVRKLTGGKTPLAVGFGVSTREHYLQVGKDADGVVIGSKLVNLVKEAADGDRADAAKRYAHSILNGAGTNVHPKDVIPEKADTLAHPDFVEKHKHNPRFGDYGGQYVPEALHGCLRELEGAFESAIADPKFWEEYRGLYDYMGRPSPLTYANRLTEYAGGARIWLKREDLNHTGSHKINNAIGQILIAKRLGKKNIIAETGAGQHGVATATAAAKFGMSCTIFMGAKDVQRQALNVFRMRILGAKVISVTNGTQTLRDATSEAFRYWVSHVKDTHYVVGSAIGPHPYPTMVRTFQSVIGREIKQQFAAKSGGKKLPDLVVACVGGGSNSSGTFSPFENDTSVQLMGCEAGGEGIETGNHSATLTAGHPGVFHGVRTYVLENEDGQIHDTYSVSAGLDYPGVGPELAGWKDSGRVKFIAVTDAEALEGFRLLSQYEGVIPALESSHAVYGAVQQAKKMSKDQDVVITVSGRGDKDVTNVAKNLPVLGPKIGWNLRFGSLDDASK